MPEPLPLDQDGLAQTRAIVRAEPLAHHEVAPHQRRGLPNPASVYLARLAAGSRRTMRQALGVVAHVLVPDAEGPPDPEQFPWELVRAEHAKAIRAHLAERYRFSTANKAISALRGVLREAWELGLVSTDDYHRAAAVRAVKGERAPQATGRALARLELRALIEACLRPTPPKKGAEPVVTEQGRRDAVVVALGYGCGLRRHELAGLALDDVDLVTRRVTVRGKGNKERVVPIPPGAFHALRDYLVVRGSGAGPLLLRARKGGRLVRSGGLGGGAPGITDQAVYHVLRTRAAAAGVAAFSPHDLRRSYVGDLLDEGADLSVAQKLAGHASPTTTAGYDRRGERAKEQAASRLDVPYR